jgi:predicted component of type VI protein secretion system
MTRKDAHRALRWIDARITGKLFDDFRQYPDMPAQDLLSSQVVLARIQLADGTTDERIQLKTHILATMPADALSMTFTCLHNAN